MSEDLVAGNEPDPYDRLGAALRAMADVVPRSGAPGTDVAEVAAQIEKLTARLAAAPEHHRVHDSPYHPMSLVGGTAHPMAPQLHTVPTDDGVEGTVLLGPAYEGGPGLVHGGVLAMLLDHAMGQVLFVTGHPAMTVSLDVRYRAPTPLAQPLAVRAGLDKTEGRKLFVSGRVTVGGRVTVEASAVFLELTAANVARVFAPGRVPG